MVTNNTAEIFRFKRFTINQHLCPMKVGTDGVLLGAWVGVGGAKSILDIGTGSGVIAIMLAQRASEATVHGVEIDEASYTQAALNMGASPYADRLKAIHCSIQDYAADEKAPSYDLIVSNPPFFTGGTFSNNENRNNIRHTVKLPNGDLLHAVRKLLTEEGRFCVILPLIEGLRFKEMASRYHLYCSKMTEVIPRKGKPVERLLIQLERNKKPEQCGGICMYESGTSNYTAEYKALTRDFYLNF